MSRAKKTFFVENLTIHLWVGWILPALLREKYKKIQTTKQVYALLGTSKAVSFANITSRLLGLGSVSLLPFKLLDVRDVEGNHLEERSRFYDLFDLESLIKRDPYYQKFKTRNALDVYQDSYLSKSAVQQLRRKSTILLIIQWTMSRDSDHNKAVLFANRISWTEAFAAYARQYDIEIMYIPPMLRWNELLVLLFGTRGLAFLKIAYDRLRYRLKARRLSIQRPRATEAPCLVVESYAQLNLNNPGYNSDLFFVQQSNIAPKDVMVAFRLKNDRLDDVKHGEILQHGMSDVVLSSGALGSPKVPYLPFPYSKGAKFESLDQNLESQWLNHNATSFEIQSQQWEYVFKRLKAKIYVGWYMYDGTHCAMAKALQKSGGILALYQRAYAPMSSPITKTTADLVFGFSRLAWDTQKPEENVVRYHVSVGFLGDHRFTLLREPAWKARQHVLSHGAQYVMAFYDENSLADERWHTGHGLQREHYTFLLEKVLSVPWFGLVVKPKAPRSLRHRLGPHLTELLKRAEATGRFYMFEEGALHSAHPPVIAALAADIAVHGHLNAGTAAVEAVLAGVPTLLLDREGWPVSPLYRLGKGNVIFEDWPSLWLAFENHFKKRIPAFGDWSSVLEELDPFRDGKAAERMGTYLQWLLDGFKAGYDRETVMSNAAERYASRWGYDKIVEVSQGCLQPLSRAIEPILRTASGLQG